MSVYTLNDLFDYDKISQNLHDLSLIKRFTDIIYFAKSDLSPQQKSRVIAWAKLSGSDEMCAFYHYIASLIFMNDGNAEIALKHLEHAKAHLSDVSNTPKYLASSIQKLIDGLNR